MLDALTETKAILKQTKGVFLVESHVRATRTTPAETVYTVTAYWTPKRFYRGNNRDAAETIFADAVAGAPARVR
jgi:hypothetical protein